MDRNEQHSRTPENTKKPLMPFNAFKWLLRILQGALIGAGAILPGVSGGALCVVFGIYQPMMALLAHPFRTFKKYALLLLPVLIGWVLGFFLIARLLNLLFNNPTSSSPATWLFVGLIAGMMPQLFREAKKQGRTFKAWIALGISMSLILTLLVILQYGTKIQIEPNLWWFFVCGIFWGLSLVVPGLSSSSLLLFLGLYQAMTAGIAHFSLGVILPMVAGIALVIFISARAISYMFEKHYSSSSHAILGFVIASTIGIILPSSGNTGASGETIGIDYSAVDFRVIILWAVCFIIGFAIAWFMDRMSKKLLSRPELEEQQ